MWSKKQEENPQGVVHFFSNISFSSCSRCRLSITLSCICHCMSNNGCMRQLCFFNSSKFWKFVHTGPKADGHFCYHLSHAINYKLLLAAALSWNFFFFSKINIDSFFFFLFRILLGSVDIFLHHGPFDDFCFSLLKQVHLNKLNEGWIWECSLLRRSFDNWHPSKLLIKPLFFL